MLRRYLFKRLLVAIPSLVIASLIVFVISDRVHYPIAFAMIAGQLIGGRLGAGMAIRHGAPFIRVIFITVVLAMVAKLLWDQFGAR